MSIFKKITLSTSIILIASCTVLPTSPSSQQNTSLPKTTRTGLKVVDHRLDLSHVQWWKKMHDPVLDQLIDEALRNNNQIQTARANSLQAQAKLNEARLAWLPTLNGSANGLIGGGWDSSFSPQGPLAQSAALSTLGNIHFHGYFSGFIPSYSLNILANIQKNKLAKASLEMQNVAYQSTRLSIISQVSGAYFIFLGQKEQLHQQTQLIRDLKKIRALEEVRFKEGASDLSSLTELDQRIAKNEGNLYSIENSISQVENSIQVLLNHNPGPLLQHGTIKALSVKNMIPANLPSAVLKNHPDIMMARQNLKISESNLGIAYSNFFPTISLTGLLGGSSIELAHLLSLSTGLWVAEAAASVPILNGVSYEQIKEAKAGYYASYYNYVQTLKTTFAKVDNSLTNQQKINLIYQNQLKSLKALRKNYALSLARYHAGANDYRDVINAKLTVDVAQLEKNLAKMQQLDSIVQVYQDLAGGYKTSIVEHI
jgi:outer membrane protein, multidrug efflux system